MQISKANIYRLVCRHWGDMTGPNYLRDMGFYGLLTLRSVVSMADDFRGRDSDIYQEIEFLLDMYVKENSKDDGGES